MKFFLDTADINAVKKLLPLGVVNGITTNPTLVRKAGADFESTIKEFCSIVDGPVSAETTVEDAEGMIAQGRIYAGWHKNIYVKVPMTSEGMKALHVLASEGIHVNVTLVFSANQALLAAKAGATVVSPFIGRLDDISEDGIGLVKDIMEIFSKYTYSTEVLVASIRHPRHVVEAAKLGAHIATMPPEVMEKLVEHPLTTLGLAKFMSDWKKG